MTPYAKVLIVVGGAAVIVSLTIAVIFVEADRAAASLRTGRNGQRALSRVRRRDGRCLSFVPAQARLVSARRLQQ